MHLVMLLTAALIVLLAAEAALVRHWREKIGIRIHVNGTRGKSSVTRYITAALRDAGFRTAGKITGVIPTLILPDGTDEPIRRRGPARVQEQIGILRRAATLRCDAVVLECMSVNPALQSLEARVLRPTLSVLTNILDDHREEFGPAPEGWVRALCSFIPRRGVLVSGERNYAGEVAAISTGLGTRVVADIPDEPAAEVMPREVFADNVALALRVCDELGLDRERARAAIGREASAGASPRMVIRGETGTFTFLNGFAVNDVPSAGSFLTQWVGDPDRVGHLVVLLNARADRPLRTLAFAGWCGRIPSLQCVIVTGTHSQAARSALRRAGLVKEKIVCWSPRQTRDAAQSLSLMRLPDGAVVAGIGNIGGGGFQILTSLKTWSSKLSS